MILRKSEHEAVMKQLKKDIEEFNRDIPKEAESYEFFDRYTISSEFVYLLDTVATVLKAHRDLLKLLFAKKPK